MNGVEPLFKIKVACICCGLDFETSRVRPSFKKATGRDTDFNVRYKNTNPDYYVVRVCPHCGFSVTENFTDKFSQEQKGEFELKFRANWTQKDFGGERTWDEALQTYKLALVCAQLKGEKDRVISGLLHHIAWLYREKGDWEQERRFLGFALESYLRVYENESSGEVNNARLMYLMGELNRRLGQYYEAVRWFSRVINDKRIMDSAMIRACREQWAETRENMMAAKMELPEEMRNS